jgi:hypothetical protein
MGSARVEVIQGILTLVVPFRVNVNKKCLTLEQLEGRRKLLHLATVDQLMWEADLEVKNLKLATAHDMQACVDETRRMISEKQMSIKQLDCVWFNIDENYAGALLGAIKLKNAMINNCVLFLKSADIMAIPRVKDREIELNRQLSATNKSRSDSLSWLQKQSVQRVLDLLLKKVDLRFSDSSRFTRALVALVALRRCLEDPKLRVLDQDDCIVSRETLMSFQRTNKEAIERSGSISRAIEYLDNKYGPLVGPKDPDRYYRDMLCCYKRALGHEIRRHSIFRCLELLEEGLSAAVHGLPAHNPWEASLLAHFCVEPDTVGQFQLSRIEAEKEPVVQVAPGVTEEDAAFLAAFLSSRHERKVVLLMIRALSLPEKPLRLLTAGAGFDHIRTEGSRTIELNDMRVGPDVLRVLVHAAEHASPPVHCTALRLSSNHDLGEFERPEEVCGLIIRLAEHVRCETLHLDACRLADAHFDLLATAVGTAGRLPSLSKLQLIANRCDLRSAQAGRLRKAWAGSGREMSRLVLELDSSGFVSSLLRGTAGAPARR